MLMRLLLTSVTVLAIPGVTAKADLVFTVAEAPGDTVNLTILGSGTATSDGGDDVLVVGTPTDTFLTNGSSLSDTSPVPAMTLGGLGLHFVDARDNGGGGNVNSSLSFSTFGSIFPAGTVNLSDLNGTYALDGWTFSNFNPGVYALSESTYINALTNLGSVSLTVVPESSAFLYGGLIAVLAGCGYRIKRRLAVA